MCVADGHGVLYIHDTQLHQHDKPLPVLIPCSAPKYFWPMSNTSFLKWFCLYPFFSLWNQTEPSQASPYNVASHACRDGLSQDWWQAWRLDWGELCVVERGEARGVRIPWTHVDLRETDTRGWTRDERGTKELTFSPSLSRRGVTFQ